MAILGTAFVFALTWFFSITHAVPIDQEHVRMRDVVTVTVQVTSTIFAANTLTSVATAPLITSIPLSIFDASREPMLALSHRIHLNFLSLASILSTSTTSAAISGVVSSSSLVALSDTSTPTTVFSLPSIPTTIPPESSTVTGDEAASNSAFCGSETEACEGDATHYEASLGACGTTNTDTDSVIALPYEFMGDSSNGNPYCGRSLTILNPSNGNSAQATVEDKCMGCEGRNIDLTPALFQAVVGDLGLGRVPGIQWWFN